VTAEHPFYHAERGWVHASKLVVGDLISEDEGGTLRVTKVTFNPNAPLNVTYNLEVADFHTYFVGEYGVLVHNGWLIDLAVGLGLLFNAPDGEVTYSPDSDDRQRRRVELTACGSGKGSSSPPTGGLNEYGAWIVKITGFKYK